LYTIIVIHNAVQNIQIIFLANLQTIITARMLSIGVGRCTGGNSIQKTVLNIGLLSLFSFIAALR